MKRLSLALIFQPMHLRLLTRVFSPLALCLLSALGTAQAGAAQAVSAPGLSVTVGAADPGVPHPVAAPPDSPTPAEQYTADFDALWQEIHDSYAYLDRKATDWDEVRAQYRPQAERMQTKRQFIALLERTLEELYDPHIALNTNTAASPRLVPTGADLWAEWHGGRAMITEVRRGSVAERAGARPGMAVISVNDIPVRQAVQARLGRCLRRDDPAADDWALRVLLAGRHDEVRRLRLGRASAPPLVVSLDNPADEKAAGQEAALPRITFHRLEADSAIGYIRIDNSLGDNGLIGQFDAGLATLRGTRGLIIDLRDTPSGGNTTVARGIMGRFISHDMFYQKHDIPSEEKAFGVRRSWAEIVSPRGPFRYSGPVVLLVDHWTGSMGEGIAVGFDAMRRGRVVGTRMAGLNGAITVLTLPNTGIGVSIPEERVLHTNGTPREMFVPPVLVDLQRQGDPRHEDLILDTGVMALRQQPPARKRGPA